MTNNRIHISVESVTYRMYSVRCPARRPGGIYVIQKSSINFIAKRLKNCSNLLQILNLLYMKNFYCMYLPYTEISQQVADQLEKKDFSP